MSHSDIFAHEGVFYSHLPRTPESYLAQHTVSHDYRLKTYGQQSEVLGLTVLLPSIPERKPLFDLLLAELKRQGIQVIWDNTNVMSIGAKRNKLLAQVTTPYVVFVDDDDWIRHDYGKALGDAIRNFPKSDYIVFDMLYVINQETPKPAKAGIEFERWFNTEEAYFRHATHIMCWRTEIAQRHTFPDQMYMEDQVWGYAAIGDVKYQTRLEQTLYVYEFLNERSATYVPNRENPLNLP